MSVNGTIGFQLADPNAYAKLNGNATTKGLIIATNTGSNNGPTIEMYGKDHVDRSGKIAFVSYENGTQPVAVEFLKYSTTGST